MQLRFLIILALILLAEYYSFVVVRLAVRNLPQVWRISLTALYIALTTIAWGGALLGMLKIVDFSRLPHLLRNIYIAFTLGFTVGKILILVVMLIDDLRRLVLWIIQSWFTAGTRTMPIDAPPFAAAFPARSSLPGLR